MAGGSQIFDHVIGTHLGTGVERKWKDLGQKEDVQDDDETRASDGVSDVRWAQAVHGRYSWSCNRLIQISQAGGGRVKPGRWRSSHRCASCDVDPSHQRHNAIEVIEGITVA